MLPHVVVHNEMSLDARMDGLDVNIGRFYTLAGTWHEDCTLVGSETLLAGMRSSGTWSTQSRSSTETRAGTRAGERPPTLPCSPPSTRADVFPAWDNCATSPIGAT